MDNKQHADVEQLVRVPTVVHCMMRPKGMEGCHYDVYVGRGRDPFRPQIISSWGNRFSHKETSAAEFKVDTIEQAVSFHYQWVLEQPLLISRIKRELKGRILGCWCVTRKQPYAPCHGWTLLEIANSD